MKIILLLFLLCCELSSGFSQNDAAKIAEAKIAIEKRGDYSSALAALREVSVVGKGNPLFIYYAAISFDNLNMADSALFFYNKYVQLYPTNAQIIQRVAELNYDTRKRSEAKIVNKDISATWYTHESHYIEEYNRRTSYLYKITQNGNEVSIKSNHTGFVYFNGIRNGDSIAGKALVYIDYDNDDEQYGFPGHDVYFHKSQIGKIIGLERNPGKENRGMSYFVLADAFIKFNEYGAIYLMTRRIRYNEAKFEVSFDDEWLPYLVLNRQ